MILMTARIQRTRIMMSDIPEIPDKSCSWGGTEAIGTAWPGIPVAGACAADAEETCAIAGTTSAPVVDPWINMMAKMEKPGLSAV